MNVTEIALRRFPLVFTYASILFLCAATYAFANPGVMGDPAVMAEKSFANMDIDKDGKVVPEEFFKVFPNMREAAFTAIDKNTDKIITLEEWKDFYVGHSKDTADHSQKMESAGAQGEPAAQGGAAPNDGSPDLVMPAEGK